MIKIRPNRNNKAERKVKKKNSKIKTISKD